MTENAPPPQTEPPKLPYNPGSKSYLVAQMLLEGKKDDDTICKEVGVKKKTLWTVKTRLRRLGLLDGGKTGTPRFTPQPSTPANKTSSFMAETPTSTPQQLRLPQQLVEEVARRVAELLKASNPQSPPPTPGLFPLEAEDVEVVGEKVNYKVALNPEIFWRYNVFKAEVERRGRKWDGTFSDFLDLATKDILAVYGIHPTVISMKGKKLLVELPVNVEEAATA